MPLNIASMAVYVTLEGKIPRTPYWAIIIVCYVTVNAIGYTYYAITNESQSTVYCKGANFIEVAEGFMINTVITNSGTSILYLTGEAIGTMEMLNKPEDPMLLSRGLSLRVRKAEVGNKTDLIERNEMKEVFSSDKTIGKNQKDYPGTKVIDMTINQGNVTEIPPTAVLQAA